jgi:signal transduction histidine kinase
MQVSELVLPLINNMRLLDQMASSAADDERRKIARDIHDSVVQPYIGLRLGLSGVLAESNSGGDRMRADIKSLIALADQGIAELRDYIAGLNSSQSGPGGNLVPAINRFAVKFTEATSIEVQVDADPTLRINDRLGAEVFQMVIEGLSNIRRHTHATKAHIHLMQQNGDLTLNIANQTTSDMAAAFTPRSITECALALGGHAQATYDNGQTVVKVSIPL